MNTGTNLKKTSSNQSALRLRCE